MHWLYSSPQRTFFFFLGGGVGGGVLPDERSHSCPRYTKAKNTHTRQEMYQVYSEKVPTIRGQGFPLLRKKQKKNGRNVTSLSRRSVAINKYLPSYFKGRYLADACRRGVCACDTVGSLSCVSFFFLLKCSGWCYGGRQIAAKKQ